MNRFYLFLFVTLGLTHNIFCIDLDDFNKNSEVVVYKDNQPYCLRIAEANRVNIEEQIDFIQAFIRKGDLVFDIGANAGDKTELYLASGSDQVICFEPQPSCIQILKEKFGNNPKVIIEPFALGSEEKSQEMFISVPGAGINTLSKEYTVDSRFAERGVRWEETLIVNLTTLDLMIQKYGLPHFCKIDVENYELEVLRGLSVPIPFLSFECNTDQLKTTIKCLDRLVDLGYTEFNYAIAERGFFISPHWMSGEELLNKMKNLMELHDFVPIWGLYGDVYARFRHDEK